MPDIWTGHPLSFCSHEALEALPHFVSTISGEAGEKMAAAAASAAPVAECKGQDCCSSGMCAPAAVEPV